MSSSHLIVCLCNVQRENGAWAGKRAKPLVVAAEKQSSYLIVGISPVALGEVC